MAGVLEQDDPTQTILLLINAMESQYISEKFLDLFSPSSSPQTEIFKVV